MSDAKWEAGDQRLRRRDHPRCGASTRAGGICRVRAEPSKARCRFHGGLSTGPNWMEDYNTVHPHSRLGYRSPREYIATQSQSAVCPV